MPGRISLLICKLIQRQTYSCLSTRYGIWCVFFGICIIIVSAFHFGEVALQWSASHYAGNFEFSRYYDNIVSKSFHTRLCLPQPIDIVYTWVNGSDPIVITQLQYIEKKFRQQFNSTPGRSYNGKSRTKLINAMQFKWKSRIFCPLPNCVSAYKIAISGLPRNVKTTELIKINPNFTLAKKIEYWADDTNVVFVSFESRDLIHDLIESPMKYNKQLLNKSEVFFTSVIKSGHKKIDAALMFYNLDVNSTTDEIKNEIQTQLPNSVSNIQLYHNDKIGVISFTNRDFSMKLKSMSAKRNFTINNRVAKVLPVTYVWHPVTVVMDDTDEDFGRNRFADNEELKYSLRSVEKFVPWVRRIFIVTNGQIPNWLNLNHPRITLVTHEDIFVNKSHLPTFSSPAIESHIHRISGLSKKFIYMNDDVFFGTEVWPDDFYTHTKGHKVFLSWSVPNCHEGCPSSWVNDKYCDKACNVSACEWDGGDCLGDKANTKWSLQASYSQYSKTSGEYCSGGCANNWVGDRYCDANCNKLLCGFDAGDCGLRNFDKLFSHSFGKEIYDGKNNHITAPPGTLAMYVNLSSIFHSVIDGNFHDSIILRTAVISKKYKLLSLTFFKNISKCTLSFQILGYKDVNRTEKVVVVFKLNVSTVNIIKPTTAATVTNQSTTNKTIVKPPVKLYSGTPYRMTKVEEETVNLYPGDFFNLSLPVELAEKLNSYKKAFNDGDITLYGYNRSKGLIYKEYMRSQKQKTAIRKLLWIPEDVSSKDQDDTSPPEKYLIDHHTTFFSFLPWEKSNFMTYIFDIHRRLSVQESYKIIWRKRHLLDTFSDSLLHVGRIYNKAFGYRPRKVPAHMPHMVDRDIIYEMQDRFSNYFDATSSHKIRHPEDMQFAFSFNYYVIGAKIAVNLSDVFDKVDSDHSGMLSLRELRSLAAMLYPLPLNLNRIKEMENHLKNCSRRLANKDSTNYGATDEYSLPLVTKNLFIHCHELWRPLNLTSEKNKYEHEIQGEDDVIFKMIRNNASYVLNQLDWIRKNRKKFICLNDDLDHGKESTKTIRAVLKDFYESFFPVPSQFELAPKYRNKFVYKWELDEWQKMNKKRNEKINVLIILIVLMLTLCLYRRKVTLLVKRLRRIASGRGRGRAINVEKDGLVSLYVRDDGEELVSVL